MLNLLDKLYWETIPFSFLGKSLKIFEADLVLGVLRLAV